MPPNQSMKGPDLMSALKLETFNPDPGARAGIDNLRSEVLEREKNEAYASGFKDGVNVTKDAVKAEQNQLIAAILEALSDAQISRREASALAVRSLAPLVDALVTHIAPALAESGFAARVVETVARASEAARPANPEVFVGPAHAGDITEMLAARGIEAPVTVATELPALEARVTWSDGVDLVDYDGYLAELRAILTEFQILTNEEADERNRNAG